MVFYLLRFFLVDCFLFSYNGFKWAFVLGTNHSRNHSRIAVIPSILSKEAKMSFT